MIEPTISCPSCHAEIKLDESLAGPLIKATREDYERRIAQSNAAIAEKQQKEVEVPRQTIADQAAAPASRGGDR